ncbi:MAG: DUF2490 domain-containing protein [Sphingorhabdus sp.]|uniref:DUF2490 domain-containing protein n=1 Tax=Sphingorhabdus sp. TaxID=1902408 RepID=UPI003C7F086A
MSLRRICQTIGTTFLLTASQAAFADSTRQQWLTLTGDVELDAKDSVSAHLILRSQPDSLDLGQRFIRLGYRHDLADDVSLSLSYAHVTTEVSGGSDKVQHRLAQAIAFPLVRDVDARIQLEEVLGVSGSDDVGLRFRPRVRLRHGLDQAGNIELQLSDEMIFALNDTDFGQISGLTANRAGAAVHFDIGKHFGIMPGYTWQLVNRSGAPVRHDHILGLTLEAHY